jgi:hypothetical protein
MTLTNENPGARIDLIGEGVYRISDFEFAAAASGYPNLC